MNLYGEVTWSVSAGASNVAVDSTGLLTRAAEGEATVTASYADLIAASQITNAQQDFVLQYNNTTSNWAEVYVYLWTGPEGQAVEVAPWL